MAFAFLLTFGLSALAGAIFFLLAMEQMGHNTLSRAYWANTENGIKEWGTKVWQMLNRTILR